MNKLKNFLFLGAASHLPMRAHHWIPSWAVVWPLLFLGLSSGTAAAQTETVTGFVFHDKTNSGDLAPADTPLSGIAVSNGREIAITDGNGQYELPLHGQTPLFVIKPSGWTSPVNEHGIPQFYYLHSPEGAAGEEFPGLQPSGSIPDSVNFPLKPQSEPNEFEALIFGDTQPRNVQEAHHIADDSIQGLIDTDAAFGVTLGDIVFDDLDVFDPMNQIIGTIGIPWRHIIGNHDIDFSAETDTDANGAYYRTYGPSYYSFAWGPAHFIAVDNIRWIVTDEDRYYRTGLGDDQLTFIRNELDRIPDDRLVVFLMHIPWAGSTSWHDEEEREALFEAIASHPKTVSLASHTHRHYHHFIGKDEGWPESEPHHLVSVGAVAGAWWRGAPDEYGIPHAMMRDGTPTGYALLKIDGNDWELSYRAARRPSDFQMHIHAPHAVASDETEATTVYANIFNALPDATVRLRIGSDGDWIPMEREVQPDPFYVAVRDREEALEEEMELPWLLPSSPQESRHIWEARLPEAIEPGAHVIEVHARDDWHHYQGRRIIRVTE